MKPIIAGLSIGILILGACSEREKATSFTAYPNSVAAPSRPGKYVFIAAFRLSNEEVDKLGNALNESGLSAAMDRGLGCDVYLIEDDVKRWGDFLLKHQWLAEKQVDLQGQATKVAPIIIKPLPETPPVR